MARMYQCDFMLRYVILLVLFRYLWADCTDTCENFSCPCHCYHKEILCSNKSVRIVPRYPEHMNVQILDLQNNYIVKLKSQSFNQKCLKNLVGLRLSSNKIKRIPSNAFHGLSKMEMLFLNHNQITKIKETSFTGLTNLKKLYLNDNQLKVLHVNTFAPLKKTLRLLYIHGNKIERIPHKLLDNFEKLKTIDLSQNRITRMDGRYFATLPLLEHIIMENNPWSCDVGTICSVMGTLQNIRKMRRNHASIGQSTLFAKFPRSLSVYGSMVCSTPQEHKGAMAESIFNTASCKDIDIRNYFNQSIIINSNGTENKSRLENGSSTNYFSQHFLVLSLFVAITSLHI